MELKDIVRMAQAFSDLGNAVGRQIEAVVNGDPADDQNPAALRLADERFLAVVERVAVDEADDDLLDELECLRRKIKESDDNEDACPRS